LQVNCGFANSGTGQGKTKLDIAWEPKED
jgi:hypothetical protein